MEKFVLKTTSPLPSFANGRFNCLYLSRTRKMIDMKKLLPFAFLLIPAWTMAQSTGFMPPTATAAPMGGWNNPENAFTSDDVYTDVPHQSGCRCPFVYLSWDNGATYTSPNIIGPFGETDNTLGAGSSSDLWGHAWTESELTNANFRLKISNPSTLIGQGYADFNFNIPPGSAITGIEVQVEQHGDAGFTTEYIDYIAVNVYYVSTTNVNMMAMGSNLSVFPNPASTQLTIENLSPSTQNIKLLNMSGALVTETSHYESGKCTINVNAIPRGMYMLVVTDRQTGTLTRKIVVQ